MSPGFTGSFCKPVGCNLVHVKVFAVYFQRCQKKKKRFTSASKCLPTNGIRNEPLCAVPLPKRAKYSFCDQWSSIASDTRKALHKKKKYVQKRSDFNKDVIHVEHACLFRSNVPMARIFLKKIALSDPPPNEPHWVEETGTQTRRKTKKHTQTHTHILFCEPSVRKLSIAQSIRVCGVVWVRGRNEAQNKTKNKD